MSIILALKWLCIKRTNFSRRIQVILNSARVCDRGSQIYLYYLIQFFLLSLEYAGNELRELTKKDEESNQNQSSQVDAVLLTKGRKDSLKNVAYQEALDCICESSCLVQPFSLAMVYILVDPTNSCFWCVRVNNGIQRICKFMTPSKSFQNTPYSKRVHRIIRNK